MILCQTRWNNSDPGAYAGFKVKQLESKISLQQMSYYRNCLYNKYNQGCLTIIKTFSSQN